MWIAIFAQFRQAASSDNSQITIERHKHQHEYWYEHVHVKNLNINFFPVNFVIKDRAICQIEFEIKLTELLSQQATSPKIQSVVGFRILNRKFKTLFDNRSETILCVILDKYWKVKIEALYSQQLLWRIFEKKFWLASQSELSIGSESHEPSGQQNEGQRHVQKFA